MTKGGFPEILLKHLNHQEYLRLLIESVIYKDIIHRYRINNINGIEHIISFLFSNIANKISYHTLSSIASCSVGTAEKYMRYIENAYLFFSVSPFTLKKKKRSVSGQKVYSIDLGFISSKMVALSEQTGKIFENLIAIELRWREQNGNGKMYCWKNEQQEEVDFAIYEQNRITQLDSSLLFTH